MKNKKIITLIIILIITIIFTIGITYAYFTANIEGSESSTTLTVGGGTLSIIVNGGNNINIQNIVPSYDSIATKTITVTGTNTIDLAMSYTMYLEIENNSFIDNAISYTLISTNTGSSGTIIPSISTNQGIYTGASTIELGSGTFVKANNIVHTYQLKIYLLETESDQNLNQGKAINGYIKVEGKEATEPNTWSNPKEGTLLKAIKDNNTVTVPLTTPGRAISTSSEKVLASTADDYGTSYYFRGAVENNYVEFAGMCWRIVRVTGDNSIKLVLYNNNESGSVNPCSVSSSTAAFAKHTGTTYTSVFNSIYGQNAYIGFMYGTPGSSTYAAEHANITKSMILTNLEKWYYLRLKNYTKYLADTIWCNDKSIDTVYPYGNSLGYGVNLTGYSARGRIYAGGSYATAANPSLVCPNAGSDNKISKYSVSDRVNGNGNLTYKIGLLTADEVAYAGARYYNADGSSDNTTYYINQNATGTWWWTLSPSLFSGSYAYVWNVRSAGSLDDNYVSRSGGLRPAVSLTSTTKITGGSGASSSPYIIQTT